MEDAISIITKAQLRAARALLAWSQGDLAKASHVSLATIKRLEPGETPMATTVETIQALQRALESAGVEFTNGGEPGVKMKAKPASIPIDKLDASNDE
jgi:transcriptional regulator with XRE-family HTH domain